MGETDCTIRRGIRYEIARSIALRVDGIDPYPRRHVLRMPGIGVPMIDVKQAVKAAIQFAEDTLGSNAFSLDSSNGVLIDG